MSSTYRSNGLSFHKLTYTPSHYFPCNGFVSLHTESHVSNKTKHGYYDFRLEALPIEVSHIHENPLAIYHEYCCCFSAYGFTQLGLTIFVLLGLYLLIELQITFSVNINNPVPLVPLDTSH